MLRPLFYSLSIFIMNTKRNTLKCPYCGCITQDLTKLRIVETHHRLVCRRCGKGPEYCDAGKEEEQWNEWAKTSETMTLYRSMPIFPRDNTDLRWSIFYNKYLPEMCGMTPKGFAALPESTLKCSIKGIFFDKVYRQLLTDHNVYVLQKFADMVLDGLDGTKLYESPDGSVWYRAAEKTLRLAFSNAVLSKMDVSTNLFLTISPAKQEELAVTSGASSTPLFSFRVHDSNKGSAWDILSERMFDPEDVVPVPMKLELDLPLQYK